MMALLVKLGVAIGALWLIFVVAMNALAWLCERDTESWRTVVALVTLVTLIAVYGH